MLYEPAIQSEMSLLAGKLNPQPFEKFKNSQSLMNNTSFKLKVLSFLELLKLEKRKCPQNQDLLHVGRDMAVL